MHTSKFIIVFGYTIFGIACIKTDVQINSDLGNFNVRPKKHLPILKNVFNVIWILYYNTYATGFGFFFYINMQFLFVCLLLSLCDA